MALPLAAPPTTSMALEVVSVNSSMLARVPGPADFDATVAWPAYNWMGVAKSALQSVSRRPGRRAAWR